MSNTQQFQIESSVLAKNTVLNFIGQVVPLFVSLVTIPYVIKGLGTERFGILSFAWVVLVYFSLFDLGLGRATTKFVAEALGKGETEKIPAIVWTSLTAQTLLGIIGGVAFLIATPLLVERVLKIPIYMISETKLAFYTLSLSIPIVIYLRNIAALLEAAQRFDIINSVKIPARSLVSILTLVGTALGYKLPGIILLITLSQVLVAVIYLSYSFKVFPTLRHTFRLDKNLILPLINFGGWVTLCNILIPILITLDRFLIGSIISISAVAYYTTPYEVISRLTIIPGAIATTLFPAFSSLSAIDKPKLEKLYAYSLKYIILILGPITIFCIVFADEALTLWLGKEFAINSVMVLQILSVGIFLNALAQMPANLLDGIGRPDLRAKIFMAYTPIYLGLLWFLTNSYGIVGTALAWTMRAGLELVIFFVIVIKVLNLKLGVFSENRLIKCARSYGIYAILSVISTLLIKNFLAHIIIIFIMFYTFMVVSWRSYLDDDEKALARSFLQRKIWKSLR